DVFLQLAACITTRKFVVSTCEELSFPWKKNPSLSRRIDCLAKKHKVSVVGVGINPGFAMDALPIFLAGVCQNVDSVVVIRSQDARSRRLPFQKKIGAGFSVGEFERLVRLRKIRHVGFTESVQMIAHALRWELTQVKEVIQPVVASRTVKSKYLSVSKGKVCGVNQVCMGFVGKKLRVTLRLLAYLGNTNACDEIRINGDPFIRSVVDGGINGDLATSAIAVNCATNIINSRPGLRTMLDIGLPCHPNMCL
ncbi:MAG: dihydrodipicolinate reductase, partial [Candidatus Woesearchaeota archaeon]